MSQLGQGRPLRPPGLALRMTGMARKPTRHGRGMAGPLLPTTDPAHLFDYGVGMGQKSPRHRKLHVVGSPQIDDKFEQGRLLDGKV